MAKPGLMNAGKFKTCTRVSFSLRRTPLIRDLDHLVKLYHKPSLTPQQELKVLAHICIWCLDYLKSDGTRKTGVDTLLQQANALIDSQKYQDVLTRRNQGHRDANPAKGRDARTIQGKALETPYKAETVIPGKGSVAGLKLKTSFKRYNVPAYRDEAMGLLFGEDDYAGRLKYQKLIGVDDEFVSTYQDKAAEMLISALPMSEQLNQLSRVMSFDESQAIERRRENFEYCSNSQREQYRVYIADGKFYCDRKLRKAFSTGQRHAIYALDEFGTLYVKFEDQMGMGSFNHSSFMSGKPVMCAGNIVIEMGVLKMLDNGSGHYRPTVDNLKKAIKFLHFERGVGMLNVQVRRCDLPKVSGQYPSLRAWDVFGDSAAVQQRLTLFEKPADYRAFGRVIAEAIARERLPQGYSFLIPRVLADGPKKASNHRPLTLISRQCLIGQKRSMGRFLRESACESRFFLRRSHIGATT